MTLLSNIADIARWKGDPKVLSTGASSRGAADELARALGWFSLALGALELAAPGRITRTLGLEGKEGLVRAYGVREITAGVLTLSTEKQIGLWARVAGDGLDLGTLSMGLRARNPKRGNVALALGMVSFIMLLDIFAAQGTMARHSRSRGRHRLYHDRSGFPRGVKAAAGAARKDFEIPADMRAAPVAAHPMH